MEDVGGSPVFRRFDKRGKVSGVFVTGSDDADVASPLTCKAVVG